MKWIPVTPRPNRAFICRNLETGEEALVTTTAIKRRPREHIRDFWDRALVELRTMVRP